MKRCLLVSLFALVLASHPAVAQPSHVSWIANKWILPFPSAPSRTPTKGSPAQFHVRVDSSTSMNWRYDRKSGLAKSEAARQATNRLLFALVSANISGEELHERATVTVKGYHGDKTVHLDDLLASAAKRAGLMARNNGEYSLSELAAMIPDDLPEGHELTWVEDAQHHGNGTPIRMMMGELADSVTDDVKGRLVSLVHISDGEARDGPYAPEVQRWARKVIAHGGSPLATNVLVQELHTGPLIFPHPGQVEILAHHDRHFLEMWDASSEMPDEMARRIAAAYPKLRIREGEERRLVAYGVDDLEQLKAIFEAGSSAAAGL